MIRQALVHAGFAGCMVLAACASAPKPKETEKAPVPDKEALAAAALAANPLMKPSDLPYHYPLFDKIKDEHFAPAFEAGMKEGAADFLMKPVQGTELVSAIRKAIEHDLRHREEEAKLFELKQRIADLTRKERIVLGHVKDEIVISSAALLPRPH